jgi:hypothetical protein
MSYGRLALAAVAATIVDAIYGFLVYGLMLAGEFGRYPGVYRSAETGPAYLPLMFVGLLVAMFALAYIYAKGYEGGPGFQEGLRFGVLIGIFVAGAFASVDYAVLNIGRRLALALACVGVVEWALNGIVIGVIYKPAGSAVGRRAAGV